AASTTLWALWGQSEVRGCVCEEQGCRDCETWKKSCDAIHRGHTVLRNNLTTTGHGSLLADQKFRCVVVVLANVLEHFLPGLPTHREAGSPWRGVGSRIIDGHVVLHRVFVRTR